MPVSSAQPTVTAEMVRARVNADTDDLTVNVLEQCVAVALAKVAEHTRDYDGDVTAALAVAIPDVIRTEATIAVAAELFNQQAAPNGILNQQYANDESVGTVAIRISADPLRPAYPLLGQWVSPVTFA